MPLIIYCLGGGDTDTHKHTDVCCTLHKSDFRKPGAPATGRRTWFKNTADVLLNKTLTNEFSLLIYIVASPCRIITTSGRETTPV